MKKILTENFAKSLIELEPLEVLGLARILQVEVMEKPDNPDTPPKEWKARDAALILTEVVEKFDKLGRKQKRQIMREVNTCAKLHRKEVTHTAPEGNDNGTTTKDR